MLRNFDLNLLLIFQTLMEERSVTRAGNRLGRTQSAVSNSLKRLRAALDDPLFVREASGLVPTPFAETLAGEVSQILARAEACLAPDREIDAGSLASHFVIGAPDRLSLPLFLPLLEQFYVRAPNLEVDMRTADRDFALRLIMEGQIHVALGWFDETPPHIQRVVAFREALVCLHRPDHPALSEGSPNLEDFLALPHLMVSSVGGRFAAFDASLARQGLARNVKTALTNFTLVPQLLKSTEMIGVFTKRTADYFATHYGLVTLEIPMEIEPISNELVWHRRYDTDPAHVWLRSQVLAACK